MEDGISAIYDRFNAILASIGTLSTEDTNRRTPLRLQIEAVVIDENGSSSPPNGNTKFVLGSINIDDASIRNRPQATVSNDVDPKTVQFPGDQSADSLHEESRVEHLVETESTPTVQIVGAERSHGTDSSKRRKTVGGLRPGHVSNGEFPSPPDTPPPPNTRQLNAEVRYFPKRRKIEAEKQGKMVPSTLDKVVEGIWEEIFKLNNLASGRALAEALQPFTEHLIIDGHNVSNFANTGRRCRQFTCASRTVRSLEVIVQAHWCDCYEARIKEVQIQYADKGQQEVKRMVLLEACASFEWTEKELRNRMSIWRGYCEIKNAAGWTALFFAGPGVYRFCKYRLGFEPDDIARWRMLRARFEVAADTLQPHWRQCLALVNERTHRYYTGHPHSWSIGRRLGRDPVPLASTYRQWDPHFSFQHIDESIIDPQIWGDCDPRRVDEGPRFQCHVCRSRQSQDITENDCVCFPDLYGTASRPPCAVQVFQTENGRNNGLVACLPFERGVMVGEFVGLVTKNLENVDCMQEETAGKVYQVWQGRYGNYTRFINHSCQPNCQLQKFTWLGLDRVIIVSKGVDAGKELTVDYSNEYWDHLDKVCLCGEPACRYEAR